MSRQNIKASNLKVLQQCTEIIKAITDLENVKALLLKKKGIVAENYMLQCSVKAGCGKGTALKNLSLQSFHENESFIGFFFMCPDCGYKNPIKDPFVYADLQDSFKI